MPSARENKLIRVNWIFKQKELIRKFSFSTYSRVIYSASLDRIDFLQMYVICFHMELVPIFSIYPNEALHTNQGSLLTKSTRGKSKRQKIYCGIPSLLREVWILHSSLFHTRYDTCLLNLFSHAILCTYHERQVPLLFSASRSFLLSSSGICS